MQPRLRPLESTAETQPQLQPSALSLSAMVSQYFTSGLEPLAAPLAAAIVKAYH
jgi:hypothetical protein